MFENMSKTTLGLIAVGTAVVIGVTVVLILKAGTSVVVETEETTDDVVDNEKAGAV